MTLCNAQEKSSIDFVFLPKTNKEFWKNKINNNVRRDKEVTLNYKNSGWRAVRIWEHELKQKISPENF